jgi:cell fate (sporulation/competence/biofilm development) regulator YlbF (YheA/YmcA/DUF963 family)
MLYYRHGQAKMAACPGAANDSTKLIMEITIEETQVNQKTKELCQAILDQPDMPSIRKRVDAFMADEKTRALYDGLMAKGQALQEKQGMSVPLSSEEIADFEQHREKLMNNPVARGFMDAQEELHQVQESIHKYVSKTLELGRVPSDEEMSEDGSCGHGCGCKH